MKKTFFGCFLAVTIATATPTPAAQAPTTPNYLTVDQLAVKPDAHLGKVTVVGRVAAATSGKGFTLIDSSNCSTCTTQCLTDKASKKIPFIWSGSPPAVKDVVKVEGTLVKTAKGYSFTAERVTKE